MNALQKLIQSAVFWNYLTVALRSGAAIVLLPLILRKLSPEEVGLWYVFLGLAGLASLLDLGFGNALHRSTAYLWAGATRLLPAGVHRDEPDALERDAAPNYELLGRLIATMRWFYFGLGLVMFFLLEIGGGAWIWQKSAGLGEMNAVRGAWALFALGCAINSIGAFWPALLTGINGVRDAQKVFLISLTVNYALAVGGLLAGLGLWALVAGQLAMGLMNRLLGRRFFLKLAGDSLDYHTARPDFELLQILWPNSWRAAAITVGLFLLVQANTLLTSVFLDLTTTASYGLSLQVVLFLSQLTTVWVLIKMPLISQLRGRHDLEGIRNIFIPRMAVCMIGYIIGSIGLYFFGSRLLEAVVGTRTPLLPPAQLALLLLVIGLESHTALYRELVQTGNTNPFVRPVLISALASVALAMVLAPYLGVLGILIAPGLVQLSFNNWWVVLQGIRSLEMTGTGYLSRLGRLMSYRKREHV